MNYFKTDILKKEFQNFTEKVLPKFWNVVCVKNNRVSGINNF